MTVLDERNWETVQDLAEVYTVWGGYAYTQERHGVHARSQFRQRFSQIVVAAKNQDTREHEIFDSDDYMQCHGGMIATVRALTGRNPANSSVIAPTHRAPGTGTFRTRPAGYSAAGWSIPSGLSR